MNRRRPNCVRPAALAAATIVLLSGSVFSASAGLRQLTFAPGIDSEPAWSPSGNTIVFSSGRPGSVGLDLWDIPAGGGAAVQLTSGISNEYGASWSPDGTTIAYYWAWEADVYLIPAAGGGESAFTTDPGGDTDPAWSPGGAEIAFTSNRGFEAVDDDADIWIQPVEGESPRQLTVSPADDEHPTWSPPWRKLRRSSSGSWTAWSKSSLTCRKKSCVGMGRRPLWNGGARHDPGSGQGRRSLILPDSRPGPERYAARARLESRVPPGLPGLGVGRG